MSAAHDHMADVERLRALHAQPIPLHRRLAGITDGAASLAKATANWTTFAPGDARLDGAITLVQGLLREMTLLRTELAREKPAAPSAA